MNTDETAKNTEPEDTNEEVATTADVPKKASRSNSILLVPYPKFIFMYPTLIVAAVAAIVLSMGGYTTIDPATQNLPVVMTSIFLAVVMANMFVIIFDFPRATSLTLVFVIATFIMGLWIFALAKPGALPTFESLFFVVRPAANATFFVCITAAMILMYVAVFISVRFNYWELRNNELLHHHGFLSDLKRYPAPNLRVDKEINDVFEFMLLGAGRLILHPSTEKRAIVLDNILFVGNKERELTRMLGSIKVQIGGDSSGIN
ncbi:hypothetical protein CA13_47690 [Planctomycetes bacterium CA13]|uniref:Uncharacterized protein n=1 Tax=Novipirellula herctigrandis TaxID=2527986 RepID=A0A5C5Z7L5_9BACT|nr:hypothetical protein CA13_47690 [Planctomycetes bacterium CA13]